MGYYRAGFEVVGVDIEPQPNYPFSFIQMDAIDAAAETGSDVIHASPPCQRYTSLTRGSNAEKLNSYPDLVASTRYALESLGKPYVIENVPGAPLREDLMLCGLMFGLRVFRHRRFEMGGWQPDPIPHVAHSGHRVAGWRHGVRYDGDMVAVYGEGGGKGSVSEWQRATGVDWTDARREIAAAVPPAYCEPIGSQLLSLIWLE